MVHELEQDDAASTVPDVRQEVQQDLVSEGWSTDSTKINPTSQTESRAKADDYVSQMGFSRANDVIDFGSQVEPASGTPFKAETPNPTGTAVDAVRQGAGANPKSVEFTPQLEPAPGVQQTTDQPSPIQKAIDAFRPQPITHRRLNLRR